MRTGKQKIVHAPAKINLCLDVRGRRPDGYHELDTIFQRLALHDTLILSPGEGIAITCDRPDLPVGPKNIVYRAVELLRREYGVTKGVNIRLSKKIPVAAGLGGGSADGAAVLRELPSFWHLPVLSAERMAALARQLGADVPFCLYGVTARAGGVGDALETLPPFIGYEVLLVNPSVPLSTARVFKNLQLGTMEHPPVDAVARAILQRDPRALGRLTGNVLEAPAMAALPVIAEIKEVLRGTGAPVVLMSGSGPTVFALHDKKGWAKRMARSIARPEWTIIATKTR